MSNEDVQRQIDETLETLMRRFDELDHEAFDADTADGKITIEFESGDCFIITRQTSVNQIWMAEPAGGWHFDWNGTLWLCDKRSIELIQTLEDLISARVGEAISLR